MSELKEIDREKLADLLANVLAAARPDRDLNGEIEYLLVNDGRHRIGTHSPDLPNYSGSIDAALALVERMLPGWAWGVIKEELRGCIGYVHNNESHFAGIGTSPNPRKRWHECRAATPPLAILAALLSALPNTQGKA